MSVMRKRLAAVVGAALTLLGIAVVPTGTAHAAEPVTPKVAPADWPTYHGDKARTGRAVTMPAAKGAPRLVQRIKLDGQVYASPIVIGGVTIVATENNSVYAIGPKLHVGWKTNFGKPSPASERPCGNIDPLGITGTPVYGPKYHVVYVAAELGGPPRHMLYALNFHTGAIEWSRSLDLPGVDKTAMQERGALTIADQRVLVPFGGLAGDCGNYKGRVIGTYRNGTKGQTVYTVPTSREAGIWTPPGPSVDIYSHAFVSVGNGASGVGDPYDHSDSILKLAPDTLKLQSYFSPKTWPTDNDSDLDLGSMGPTLVDGKWILAVGKSGVGYVTSKVSLGGIGGAIGRAQVCQGAYGGSAVYRSSVYVPCSDGLRAVAIGPKGGLRVVWRAGNTETGSPVLGGGRVWTLDPFSGILYGLSGITGKIISQTQVGGTSRFATPAIYGNRLIVPTLAGITVVSTS